MLEKIMHILEHGTYQIPSLLITNYKELKLSDIEFITLIYLMNTDSMFAPKEIGNTLHLSLEEVLETISSLEAKGFIKIEMKKRREVREEHINLEGIYQKLAFSYVEEPKEKEAAPNLFTTFETEFARPLSPIEYELINGWKENDFSDELITLALKEAVYNGVTNLRYIDKILYEWKKKGIRTKEQVEQSRVAFKSKKEEKQELFDYDWLDDNA
ncbi:MAG TPA: DnaD domain protein [Candidatus Fimihabitans intestinipullorum]|uniref:DnaD domain protein n=1 Tax=Candidatus Fimihabitans intestinipullorum TaxID=2840820 RepID=A0A9D1HV01_9BACT|nr:DnaD domain protein [Candidatus Fimihabitans intestinipullorum]